MDGCKQKQGMCIHEKLMMVMVAIVAIVGAVWLVK
jgi:hypothetical protein